MAEDPQNPESKIADFRNFPETSTPISNEVPTETNKLNTTNDSLIQRPWFIIAIATSMLILGIMAVLHTLNTATPKGKVKAPPLTLPSVQIQNKSLKSK